jgi:hypothetical protein
LGHTIQEELVGVINQAPVGVISEVVTEECDKDKDDNGIEFAKEGEGDKSDDDGDSYESDNEDTEEEAEEEEEEEEEIPLPLPLVSKISKPTLPTFVVENDLLDGSKKRSARSKKPGLVIMSVMRIIHSLLCMDLEILQI